MLSGGVIILLIIVVWLFVLAPLLMRGTKPIRKSGEAYEETRVLHHGGTELPAELSREMQRRAVPETAKTTTPEDVAADQDYEVVSEEDIIIDDLDTAEPVEEPQETVFTARSRVDSAPEAQPDVIDGDIVHELVTAPTAEQDDTPEATEAPETGDFFAEVEIAEGGYDYDSAYLDPDDLLYENTRGVRAVDAPALEEEAPELHDDEPVESYDELSADERAFAEKRARRGGWDPEAAQAHSASTYQRRRRTLVGLAAAIVLGFILGFAVGGWTWWIPTLAVVATAVYLVALRKQVQEETALRRRRIHHLRRARLGVASRDAHELNIPRQLRHPGAVVVDRDDESPDFAHLEVATYQDEHGDHDPGVGGDHHPGLRVAG
ncbi:divisome protein SepX/GlpR [Corynebacterium renale]|uniref:Uncharacterized protein n=1 Tax=Corynebacterium renale TaxID=1724 RepID=A0A2A9DKU0_9CORY|nr:gephyrin-like molybdotransferase receptor GlpR [Corynebacterium renale]PFG26976.1 hypothetical protein ATK06_0017 [Corynebacterium renale]SQI25210.1 hypothetical membrane protein [Corynebacterium renale]